MRIIFFIHLSFKRRIKKIIRHITCRKLHPEIFCTIYYILYTYRLNLFFFINIRVADAGFATASIQSSLPLLSLCRHRRLRGLFRSFCSPHSPQHKDLFFVQVSSTVASLSREFSYHPLGAHALPPKFKISAN